MSRSEAGRGYHHGDLRETLLEAALARIETHGTEQLSLRALAREAGVSATAPYRHFPSRRCLLAALITRGFVALGAQVAAARDRAGDETPDKLVAAGLAYVEFARRNPTSYHLMFSPVLGDFSDYDELKKAAEASYAVVLDIIEELLARPGAPPLTVTQASGVLWAAVHGLSSLLLFGRDRGAPASERSPLASLAVLQRNPEEALRLMMRGLTN